MPALTRPRWEIFAQGVATGKDPGLAYRDAGFHGDRRNAWRLQKNLKIRARVAELLERRAIVEDRASQSAIERSAITKERVAREFAAVGMANMADYLRLDASGEVTVDLSGCTREQMAAIAAVQLSTSRKLADDGHEVTTTRARIRLHPKLPALDNLCRLFGWTVEGHEDLDGIAAKLRAMTPEQREEDARQLMLRVRTALAQHAPLIEQMPEDEEPPEP